MLKPLYAVFFKFPQQGFLVGKSLTPYGLLNQVRHATFGKQAPCGKSAFWWCNIRILIYWRIWKENLEWIGIFLGKVTIRNVNNVWATAFVCDARTDVRVKVSRFLIQKKSRPEGHSNPQTECSNYLSYQGLTFTGGLSNVFDTKWKPYNIILKHIPWPATTWTNVHKDVWGIVA